MSRIVTDYLDITKEKYPDKIAFVDDKRSITFSALYEEAVKIASSIADTGYFGCPVLIYMEKSISMISSFLGTAYSGNFYTPADTKMPDERMKSILDRLNPSVIITDRKHEEDIRRIAGTRDIKLYEDLVNAEADMEKVSGIRSRIKDTDILYVMFTSGSTGIPKGVMIDHRAVIDFTDWISECYRFDEETVFAGQAQLYFDLSLQDVYAPLRNGSETILIPGRVFSFPVRVWNMILKHGVNTLVWVPSMLRLFADLDVLAHVEKAPLKNVLFCGEVMPVKQLNYWMKNYPDTVFANLYGPTECTEACTFYTIESPLRDDKVLPIGKPCKNTDVFVVGESGNIISKPGVTGELYVGGICLGRGYYGDNKATDEAFVPHPADGTYDGLVYRTGDLVMYNEKHELVFVGRKDQQIKVHGYRVELGDIESAANFVDGVTYGCCLYDPDSEQIILVYTGDVDEEELDVKLKGKLRDYMIPKKYVHRDSIIFNSNGKTDRKALLKEYLDEQGR